MSFMEVRSFADSCSAIVGSRSDGGVAMVGVMRGGRKGVTKGVLCAGLITRWVQASEGGRGKRPSPLMAAEKESG